MLTEIGLEDLVGDRLVFETTIRGQLYHFGFIVDEKATIMDALKVFRLAKSRAIKLHGQPR